MNIKTLGKPANFILLFIFLVFIIGGCASDKDKKNKESANSELSDDFNADLDDDLVEKINTAKKIFYSLPSPLETAMLIKTAGAAYDESLLNPVSNADKYSTNLKMALNLGIYSTDLSYASLFDQSQATLNYINAAKKMADGLEILDAIDEQTISRLEENINNRNVIIDIISETLLNSTSFLEDRGLQATSAVILVGGWVEGLYIATNLVPPGADLKNNKLVERIADQKLSLNIVISLLENNQESVEAQSILKDVKTLERIFDQVKIELSENHPVKDPKTNVTTIKSESASAITISRGTFNELKKQIDAIRTRYIS
ncbi:MAG TPA: hypothetical protein VE870_15425 [Bacteroidales bacterium]|nr:hypothetical protein [Bacteroidales bacterium]